MSKSAAQSAQAWLVDQAFVLEAAALGLAAGLRSTAPFVALVRKSPEAPPLVRGLASMAGAGEFIADKLPFMPARSSAWLSAARVGVGAAAGGFRAHSRHRPVVVGALVGGGAALLAAQLGTRLRERLASRYPDMVPALIEDAAAASLSSWAAV